MPLNIPDGFGSAAIYYEGNDGTKPYVTTFGIDRTESPDSPTRQANACFSWWTRTIGSITSNRYTITKCSLTISEGGVDGSVDSTLPPVVGSGSGNYEPIAMAAIVSKKTGALGRAGRGRMFLPGVLTEGNVGPDGGLDNSLREDIQEQISLFGNFLLEGELDPTGFPADPIPMTLLHTNPAFDPTEVTGLVVSSTVGWIRSRLR